MNALVPEAARKGRRAEPAFSSARRGSGNLGEWLPFLSLVIFRMTKLALVCQVLSWRLSNTMAAGFRVEALEEALATYGRPEIFNTDQGSQFTSFGITGVLKAAEIKISMVGRGRSPDNR